MEEGGGKQYNEDNGPEVDELCGKDRRITISQDGEVIALDIEEGKDNVFHAMERRSENLKRSQVRGKKVPDEAKRVYTHFQPSLRMILNHLLHP